jgi:SET domain
LAVLCHEHAETNKLPELDKEISFQRAFEQKAEAIVKTERNGNHHKLQFKWLTGDNVFFCGIEGSNYTSYELRVLEALASNMGTDNGQRREMLSFCLPCDMKDEVHSKPPGYKHVNSLQYQPGNKPPRLPQAGDICECVTVCDENCINRTLYNECFGDPSIVNGSTSPRQLTNCNVGSGCGNRQLGQRKTAKCKPAPEPGRGWGLVALQKIKKNDLVVEYVGDVIDEATKERRLNDWSKEHPNDTNFYIMALQSSWYIDARFVANTARFVNHSCDPNCILLPINVNGWSRCGIFALRDIEAGEFLSYDYHFDTQQTDKFICCCGALNCRGTMKHKSAARNNVDDWEVAKAEYDRDIKFLESRKMNTTSLVCSYVPAADLGSKDEFIANGPQKKHSRAARHNRMFLPRNATVGFEGLMRQLGEESITGCDDSNDNDLS